MLQARLQPIRHRRTRLLVFPAWALVALGIAPGNGDRSAAHDKAPAAKCDKCGDSLPDGALARFGTLRWRHGDTVGFIALLPDGKTILTGSADNSLRLWDRATGKEIRRFTVPASAQPQTGAPVLRPLGVVGRCQPALSLTRDGKTLAVVLPKYAIQLWDVASGKEILKLNGPPANDAVSILFAPDGKTLVAALDDQSLVFFDSLTGEPIRRIQSKAPQGGVRFGVGAANSVGGLAYSPDSKTLASAEEEYGQKGHSWFVKLTNTETFNVVRRIEVMPDGASVIVSSPDNKALAFANGTAIHVVDPDTGTEIRKLDAPTGVAALAFAPDSKTLAVKGVDQVVRIVNVATGKDVHQLGEPVGARGLNAAVVRYGVFSSQDLAFSADGKTVATGAGNTLRLWDTDTGKEIALPDGHRGPVSALTVSPDGKTVVARTAEDLLRRWDIATGDELGRFHEPLGSTCVAFSPDDRTVAFGRTLACADSPVRRSKCRRQNGRILCVSALLTAWPEAEDNGSRWMGGPRSLTGSRLHRSQRRQQCGHVGLAS